MDLQLCYLWMTPLGPNAPAGPVQPVLTPKNAPYFLDVDIEFRAAGWLILLVGCSVLFCVDLTRLR